MHIRAHLYVYIYTYIYIYIYANVCVHMRIYAHMRAGARAQVRECARTQSHVRAGARARMCEIPANPASAASSDAWKKKIFLIPKKNFFDPQNAAEAGPLRAHNGNHHVGLGKNFF